MSLRSAALRIASELPVGDPTRRKLLAALKRARKPENAAQIAIWDAWDALDGIDKVREYSSFAGAARSLVGDIEVDAEYRSSAYKMAEKVEKKLTALDRQTRSWRTGYNMWLEGRGADLPRLLRGLEKTQATIKAIWKLLASLKRDADPGDFATVSKAANKAMDAFDRAISILQSGNY